MTKDVNTYRENFCNIDFKVIGCQRCKSSNVVCNGNSFRKKAQVFLKRLLCKDCGACLIWLPPFLLPHKHYPVTQIIPTIKEYLMSSAGYLKVWENSIEEFSFSTFLRWLQDLSCMANGLYQIARKTLVSLKPNWDFEKDKRLFNACFPAMNNQNLNLLYKIFILEEYFVFKPFKPEEFFVWLIFKSRNSQYEIARPDE